LKPSQAKSAKKLNHGRNSNRTNFKNHHHRMNKKHRISNRNTKKTLKYTTRSPVERLEVMASDEESGDFQQQLPPNIEVINVTAKVGETVILTCAVNSSFGINPGVIWMQGKLGNVLTLNTNRITLDPRFDIIQHAIQQSSKKVSDGFSSDVSSASGLASPTLYDDYTVNNMQNYDQPQQQLQHQLVVAKQTLQNEISYYNLRIENVQLYDENEYACETSLTRRNDDTPNLHSLMFLHITRNVFFLKLIL
jgi:hypothetical protein